eukprot:364605-Chlamydomonas_euryale.AAC.2
MLYYDPARRGAAEEGWAVRSRGKDGVLDCGRDKMQTPRTSWKGQPKKWAGMDGRRNGLEGAGGGMGWKGRPEVWARRGGRRNGLEGTAGGMG